MAMSTVDMESLALAMKSLPVEEQEAQVVESSEDEVEVVEVVEPQPKKQKSESILIYDVTPPWRLTSQATTAATATSSSVHAGIEYSHASRDKWTHVLGRSSVHAGIEYSHASRDKWILFL